MRAENESDQPVGVAQSQGIDQAYGQRGRDRQGIVEWLPIARRPGRAHQAAMAASVTQIVKLPR